MKIDLQEARQELKKQEGILQAAVGMMRSAVDRVKNREGIVAFLQDEIKKQEQAEQKKVQDAKQEVQKKLAKGK